PPTVAIPTDDELTDYLGELKDRPTARHPYNAFAEQPLTGAPVTRRVPWRGGPALSRYDEWVYDREREQ
ncbi:hypothetical protein, partial [Planotetraspora phitsanulokensis]